MRKYKFKSLFGKDKKKVLSLLPESLRKVQQANTCTEISKVWADRNLYEEVESTLSQFH